MYTLVSSCLSFKFGSFAKIFLVCEEIFDEAAESVGVKNGGEAGKLPGMEY